MEPYLWIILGAAALVIVRSLRKVGALHTLIPSGLSGVVGLLAAHFAPIGSAAMLGINGFTVCVALLLGMPGVIGMLLLRVVCLI